MPDMTNSPKSRPLRLALGANAIFSAACGLALLAEGPAVAAVLGALPAWMLTALGVGLLGFAAAVALTAARLRIGAALLVSLLDLGWVLATVPLVLVPGLLTPTGAGVVLAVAAMVGGLGAAQLLAIRAMLRDPGAGPGRWRHCLRLRTGAPAAALWPVVADLGSIERYSPGLARSGLRGGAAPGVGAVRDCADPRGRQWSEEVETFDPTARRLTLRFLTDAPGFPFPVSVMAGGWQVAEDGAGGSIVEVWWSLTPTSRLGWLAVAAMTLPLDLTVPGLVARMADAAEGRPVDAGGRAPALAYC